MLHTDFMKRWFHRILTGLVLSVAALEGVPSVQSAPPALEPVVEVVTEVRQRVPVASADPTTDTLNFSDPHGFVPGQKVTFLPGGGQIPDGLVAGNVYFVIRVNDTSVKFAETEQNAGGAGVAIDFASGGTAPFFLETEPLGMGTRVTTQRGGVLVLNVDGTYTYTPPKRLLGAPGNVSELFYLTLGTGNVDGGGSRKIELELNGAKDGPAQQGRSIPTLKVLAGRSLVVPLRGSDGDGDALTYRVTSSNSRIQARVKTGNPYLKLQVKQTLGSTVVIDGVMEFQLFRDLAPNTVNYIAGLAQSGYYDDQIFHRIIKDFVIQGGDPGGTGTGGPGFQFEDEFHPALSFCTKGQLAMANSGKNISTGFLATNGSQFFVTTGAQPPKHLNFKHTIFGQLVRGFDVLAKCENVVLPVDAPEKNLKIVKAEMVENHQDAVLTIGAAGVGGATLTVGVSDGVNPEVKRTLVVEGIPVTESEPGSENLRTFLVPPENAVVPKQTVFSYNLSTVDLESDYPIFQYGVVSMPPGGPETGSMRSGQSSDVAGHGASLVQVLAEAGVTGKAKVAFGTYGLDMRNRNLTQPDRGALTNCSTTANSKVVRCDSTAKLVPNLRLYQIQAGGDRVPVGAEENGVFKWARVEAVTSATEFTMTVNAVVAATGLTWTAVAFPGPGVDETGVPFSEPVLLTGVTTSVGSELVTCQNTAGLDAGMSLYLVGAGGSLTPFGFSVAGLVNETTFALPFQFGSVGSNEKWLALVAPTGIPESTDFALAELGVGGASVLLLPERLKATRGVPITDQTLTGFVMADSKGVPGDFTARILWGDSFGSGSGRRASINTSEDTDAATRPVITPDLRSPRLGAMAVRGTHTYQKPGVYPLVVDVMDSKGLNRRSVGVVRVGEPGALEIQANVVQVRSAQIQNRVLASFRDPAGGSDPAGYRAVIDWGNGGRSVGSISGNKAGEYVVRGTHKYQDPKLYPVSVRVWKVGQPATEVVDWGIVNAIGFTGTPHLPPFPQARLVAFWETQLRTQQVFTSSDKGRYLLGNLVILNQGRLSSKDYKIGFYISSDKDLSADDTQLSIRVGTTDVKDIPLAALKSQQGVRLPLTKGPATDFRLRIPDNVAVAGKNLLLKLDYSDPLVDASPANRKIMVAGPLPAFQ
jgi:cyclophilin family peptidyl-prolyl cis-trans isomerase